MSAHGERKEETVVVEKILRSITSRLNYVVCSIEEYNDVTLFPFMNCRPVCLFKKQE